MLDILELILVGTTSAGINDWGDLLGGSGDLMAGIGDLLGATSGDAEVTQKWEDGQWVNSEQTLSNPTLLWDIFRRPA